MGTFKKYYKGLLRWANCSSTVLYCIVLISYRTQQGATPDAPKVLSRQTQDSMDLGEDQAGPSTVLRSASSAPPHTPSAPVLPRDAPPPRQRAHRTITDLSRRESGDESLDSDSSEGSAQ